MANPAKTKARLEVRQAKLTDVRAIADLVRRAYVDLPPYTLGEIRGQLNNYREGCFVAKLDGKIVGYCASMRLSERLAFSGATWDEITGNGFGSRHNAKGEWLYGYELCVDPKTRGTRIGRRLYEERRALAERLDLTGIVFAGRMPGLAKAMRRKTNRADTPEDYLDKVIDNKIHDPVLRFQLANGFEPQGVIEGYLPEDKPSKAFAVRMVWRNPYVDADAPKKHRVPRDVEGVRIATCQLQARAVSGFDEFMRHVEYFVDVASDYESDFIVFPDSFCRNSCDWRTQGRLPSWLPWFWVAAVGSCQWPAICSGACSMACRASRVCHPWSQGLDCPAKVVDDGFAATRA